MRENLVTVFQTDRIHRGGKDLYDHSVNLDAIIFSHMQFLFVLQKNETEWEFYADEGRMARKIPSSQLANAKRRFAKLAKFSPVPRGAWIGPVPPSLVEPCPLPPCGDSPAAVGPPDTAVGPPGYWLSGLPTRHRDIRMSALKVFPTLQKLVVLFPAQQFAS